MKTTETGKNGEKKAAAFLMQRGYDIIGLNYHSKFGEIDIIARNEEYIVFVEVKTRNDRAIYSAKEAVDIRKQRRIISTALQYLAINPTELQPRFDIAEVYIKSGAAFETQRLNYIENAFIPEENSNAIF